MKRVVMFGGCIHRPVLDLNRWLTNHPEIELLNITPMKDGCNTLLFCTVNVPDDKSKVSEKLSEYFGFTREGTE